TPEGVRAAVLALGEHQSEEATRVLRDWMEQEHDPQGLIQKTRPFMVRSIVKLNPPDLEAILRRHLNNPDDVTRRFTAEEIGQLKDRHAISDEIVPALTAAYTSPQFSNSVETKRAMVTTLFKFDTVPEAARVLVLALQDPSQVVRARAVQYMTRKTGQDYSSALGLSEAHVD